jgi:gamma-butyrobetaine dioxygenase
MARPLPSRPAQQVVGSWPVITSSDASAKSRPSAGWRWHEHSAFLDEYADVLATAQDCAAAFRMDAGDLLVMDDYRFLHGRDAYRGERTLHVLTVGTTDAF